MKIITPQISFSYSMESSASAELLRMRHCHDSYELLYVVQGTGRYIIEGAEFPMRPRTLVMIRPFEYHCVEVCGDTPYERYVLQFNADALVTEARIMLEGISGESGDSGRFYPPEMVPQAAISVMERFAQAQELPAEEQQLLASLLLSEIVLFLSLASSQRIVHNEGELGARVLRYINEYLAEDMSLDRLAHRFFVSKYYLCRTFKKYSGVSIHSYINHKRVMYAKQLIEGGETASGAAYRVGFGDYSAFYRAYVKLVGKPPTAD